MILFLDDDSNRTKKFRSYFPAASTAATADEMISLLQSSEEFEAVFLDHDLGGEQYADSNNKNTGMEVVRWIETNQPIVEQFVIHSCNYPAAQEMASRLRALGYSKVFTTPFPSLNFGGLDAN